MTKARIGMRVSADISILRSELGQGLWTPGEIIAIAPDKITVRIDSPFNGVDVFDVPPKYCEPI